MKFELQPDEKLLAHAEVELVDDRRLYPATLYLTTQRAVLTYAHTPRSWLWGLNWMIALVAKAAAHAREQVRYQIRRDRFATIEQGDGTLLVFRDTGEGYAHTSFAVRSHTPFAVWQERMTQWAAGAQELAAIDARVRSDDDDDDDAPELPVARIVDR
ncbi:MAG TPA: hypothetical protein VFS15_11780 [Kofleriaceae bacterium]|nr:hypothetical protein [Kofleriaceae bacterium]